MHKQFLDDARDLSEPAGQQIRTTMTALSIIGTIDYVHA